MNNDNYPNTPFEHYYYGEQVYQYLLQFMAIFSGLKVSVGKSDLNPDGGLIYVPIRYGASDKVVEWILSGQSSNKPIRLPLMVTKILNSELAPELRKGMRTEISNSYLPRGGTMPDDMRVIRQMQPNPVRLNMELVVATSNNKNRFEIYEQLMIMFDPDLQIYTSDDFRDHYKINRVELVSSTFDDEYPLGTAQPILTDTYLFNVVAYFRAPIDLKENIVKAIRLRLDATSSLTVEDAVIELNNSGVAGDILFDVDDMNIPEN